MHGDNSTRLKKKIVILWIVGICQILKLIILLLISLDIEVLHFFLRRMNNIMGLKLYEGNTYGRV